MLGDHGGAIAQNAGFETACRVKFRVRTSRSCDCFRLVTIRQLSGMLHFLSVRRYRRRNAAQSCCSQRRLRYNCQRLAFWRNWHSFFKLAFFCIRYLPPLR